MYWDASTMDGNILTFTHLTFANPDEPESVQDYS
jgi:hypothetical protein